MSGLQYLQGESERHESSFCSQLDELAAFFLGQSAFWQFGSGEEQGM